MYKLRFRNSLNIPFYPLRYVTHFLIALAVIVSLFGFTFPILIGVFGIHRLPVYIDTIPYLLGQLIFYQFLHGGALHLFLNSYFLYSAGPEVEARMKGSEFLLFFFGNTVFVAISLWLLSNGNTIGISGFCMALLSYLYMDLQRLRHPMANQVLIMLVINILLGLSGGISFVGHAAGAVWGIFWWQWRKGR